MKFRTLFGAVAVAIAMSSAAEAQAGFSFSESFESVTVGSSNYNRYNSGTITTSSAIWNVGGTGVDILTSGHGWQAASEGTKFLDLNGASAMGLVSTTLTGLAEGLYTLSFDARHNDGTGNSQVNNVVPRPFDVTLSGGATLASALTTTSEWFTHTFQFTVTDSTQAVVLSFISKANSIPTFSGAYIDKISISSVPEPSSIALAGLGVAGLIGRTIRRRRQAA